MSFGNWQWWIVRHARRWYWHWKFSCPLCGDIKGLCIQNFGGSLFKQELPWSGRVKKLITIECIRIQSVDLKLIYVNERKQRATGERNCPELQLQSVIRPALYSHHWLPFCLILAFECQVPAWKTYCGLYVIVLLKSTSLCLPFYMGIVSYSMFF